MKQMDASRAAHHRKMTETPVSRLVSRLAVPTVISMLVSSIYNMADTFFVSQLGTSAAGAVGVVFSIMAVIQAVGFTIGMGSGVIMSRQLGAQEDEAATVTSSTAFFFSLVLGIILAVAGLLGGDGLLRMLGATETVLPYAEAYADWIFLGCPFMCASFVMNNLLRSEGKASFAMIGITVGGVLNIVLDPLFIFTFGLGTAGAAIATSLSQIVSFFILLAVFITGHSNVSIRLRAVSRKVGLYGDIIKMGLPSLSRQGLASLASVALNVSAAAYGDVALAAMTVANRTTFLLFSVLLGFGQGFQPVCSYNWGAGLYGRVRQAVLFTAAVGTVLMALLSSLAIITAPALIGAFTDDPLVLETGIKALRAQCVVLFLSGVSVTTNMSTQGTGRYGVATLLALARQGLFFIPIVLLLPRIMGLDGVIYAQGAADILTFCLSLPFLVHFLKDLKQRMLSVKRA